MAEATVSPKKQLSPFKRWFFEGQVKEVAGPHAREGQYHTHPWWQVMCLTGVDYFSTLGYQPGIAFLAAGALSPVATLILVLLTLFGALPMYRRVAEASPHGDGSISMLEDLLPRWRGKMFVLALLGFAATSFIITVTMSAADATAHVIENPFAPHFLHHPVAVTLVLIAALGAVFIKGFKEAIGIAVLLVVIYILLNLIVIGVGLYEIATHPDRISDWRSTLFTLHGSPLAIIGASMLLFPKLALGLSGFETGVVVMPLVKGDETDTQKNPVGRIRNGKKLLLGAAAIMSLLLICSSLITTLLIPANEFQQGGKAYGRALAFLAHSRLGGIFGTIYDLSTISILWFAGSSALAGLLNIIPRYLPRYGMAPEWARAVRPLTLVLTVICFIVTIAFKADVNSQGGAYATGVLALIFSAAIAVAIEAWHRRGWQRWFFLIIALIFGYTTAVNIYTQPEGLKIASFFIGAIIVISFISRALRSTELRVEGVELNDTALRFIEEARQGTIRIVANRPDRGDADEYRLKEKEERWNNHIPANDPVLFFEIRPSDASDFSEVMKVRGVEIGSYRVLRTKSPAVPNAIAAFLLHVRDTTGQIPHVYFGWTEGNPFWFVLKFIFFGEGDTAPVTHEILRQAEPDRARRPAVHVGG
jgi:hypothetical protein